MELGHDVQLIVGITIAITCFVAAFMMSTRLLVPALIALSPFAIIDSHYGSSTTAIVYLVTVALLLRHKLTRFPLAGAIASIMVAYAISLIAANVSPSYHILYIVRILPGFMLFYIVYNYVWSSHDHAGFIKALLIINIVVLIICVLQFKYGSRGFALFGIEEFEIMANRNWEGRLSGPFGAEFTSEYLALASLLLAHLIMNKIDGLNWPKWFLWIGLTGNIGFMFATGSRGGIIVFVFGVLWSLLLFIRRHGAGRAMGFLLGGLVIGSTMFVYVIQHSYYNVLLDRIESTEVKDGVPDTRSRAWAIAMDAIEKQPFLGYGPRLRLYNDMAKSIPGHIPIPYPHSMPLFLLYTMGVFGLVAYTLFFLLLLWRFYAGSKGGGRRELRELSMLGFILLALFMIDEIKIEFLRIIRTDYQAIIFSMLGGFLAIADRARVRIVRPDPEG